MLLGKTFTNNQREKSLLSTLAVGGICKDAIVRIVSSQMPDSKDDNGEKSYEETKKSKGNET